MSQVVLQNDDLL